MGRAAGITEAQHRDLATYRTSDEFSDLEKNVLDYATALTGTRVDVTDEVFEELQKNLSDAQILELTHAIMRGADRARLNRALDVENDDIPEAAYCLVEQAHEVDRSTRS